MPADDAYHRRIQAAVERLRGEGETTRADRLEQALKRADELLGQMEGDL